MIQTVYHFPVMPRPRYFGDNLEPGAMTEIRRLTFQLIADGPISGRFVCTDCEHVAGRAFKTFSFQVRPNPTFDLIDKALGIPEEIVQQMRQHADDHTVIGAVETKGKTLLTAEEHKQLVMCLRSLRGTPKGMNYLFAKLGV